MSRARRADLSCVFDFCLFFLYVGGWLGLKSVDYGVYICLLLSLYLFSSVTADRLLMTSLMPGTLFPLMLACSAKKRCGSIHVSPLLGLKSNEFKELFYVESMKLSDALLLTSYD